MYILFTNGVTADEVIEFLEGLGLTDSHFGPTKKNALGICTSSVTNNYTLLWGSMLSNDPRLSWITQRHLCKSFQEFKEGVIKQHELYMNRNKH